MWGDLNTVGRVTGAPLRLREEKTDHPTPTPSPEGRGDAHPRRPWAERGRFKQKVDLKSNAQGTAQAPSTRWIVMSFARIEQRNAHLASSVKLE